MRLNEFGKVVKRQWVQTGVVRTNVELDEFQIMPNHFHGIIILNNNVGETRWVARFPENRRVAQERAIQRITPTKDICGARSGSIGAIIGQFKSIATKQINAIRNTQGFPVWQRNYYEHIIRDNDEMNRIREYIIHNPLQWAEDENNPANIKS